MLSIAWYSKEEKQTQRFENWICFCPRVYSVGSVRRAWASGNVTSLQDRKSVYTSNINAGFADYYQDRIFSIGLKRPNPNLSTMWIILSTWSLKTNLNIWASFFFFFTFSMHVHRYVVSGSVLVMQWQQASWYCCLAEAHSASTPFALTGAAQSGSELPRARRLGIDSQQRYNFLPHPPRPY